MPEQPPDDQVPDGLLRDAHRAVMAWRSLDLRRLKNNPAARKAVWNARRASEQAFSEISRIFNRP